jgi:hypothetical protein
MVCRDQRGRELQAVRSAPLVHGGLPPEPRPLN